MTYRCDSKSWETVIYLFVDVDVDVDADIDIDVDVDVDVDVAALIGGGREGSRRCCDTAGITVHYQCNACISIP